MNRSFSLLVEFRRSAIEGRGVFAKRRFEPGQFVVAYAPKQRRLAASDPRAAEAADTKFTLLSEEQYVIVPDTSVPGGWLCNHSCEPNAAIYSDGAGRVQCVRPIERGEEVTVFYGWVTQNQPDRDPCRCGSPRCRGFINFDVTDGDAAHAKFVDGQLVVTDGDLAERLAEYSDCLRSIGQEHVQGIVASALKRMKDRKGGGEPPDDHR